MAEEEKKKVVEGRGASDLVYALVTDDTSTAYTTSEVKHLLPLATISKTTESSSEAHYYDNVAAVNINSEGADEITITGALIDSKTLAEILGKGYDTTTGAYSDCEAIPPYVAIGYKSQNSDGSEYYAWRYKGTFSIPDENANTQDEGTEGVGTELVYKGIYTTHEFTNGKGQGKKGRAKGIKVNTADDLADLTTFFDTVTTCDTLKAKPTEPVETAQTAKAAKTTK